MVVGKKAKLPKKSHKQPSPEPADSVGLVVGSSQGRSDDVNGPEAYNSGDEYDRPGRFNLAPEEIDQMEKRFEKKMRKKGFIIKKMAEDGACLFRAVADQIYGDQDMHSAVRKLCMDYMAKNADYFSHYITEDFSEYIMRKRRETSHGNHVEIQALSEMFNRPIEVYHYNSDPINIFQGCTATDNEPIRLSYHQNIHYNSVVDPYKATIGVGLGLPAFKPGAAEKTLMEKAIRISEEQELEKVMLEDKLRATDWEATNEAIEEQIARESYVEWLRDNERRASKNKKIKLAATATATTTTTTTMTNCDAATSGASPTRAGTSQGTSCRWQKSPSPPPRQSPKAGSSGVNTRQSQYRSNGFKLVETASFVNHFPPQMFGINDWDTVEEGDILAQVLAQSQQEYLDSLKRKVRESSPEGCNNKNEKRKFLDDDDTDTTTPTKTLPTNSKYKKTTPCSTSTSTSLSSSSSLKSDDSDNHDTSVDMPENNRSDDKDNLTDSGKCNSPSPGSSGLS